MNAIETVLKWLEKQPQLTYTHDLECITIDAPTGSGFSVWLIVNNPGLTVGYDGWHEEFEDEAEALDAFAFGLSDRCRLKVTKRGDTDTKWIMEGKREEGWIEESTTGLIFIPFWRKKSVEYRQNFVTGNGDTNVGGGVADET